ncbi:MAG: acyltransferase domain-containing protein [Candidatus Levybacteria bacterium]|nr:acyltransferase domain-containing protein [Candidatus Levybacteria bacterium]
MTKAELGTQIPFGDLALHQVESVEKLDPNLRTIILFSGQARKLEDVRQQGTKLINHDIGSKVFKEADEVLNGHFPQRFKEGISRIILTGSDNDLKENLQLIILLNDLACTRVFEQAGCPNSISNLNIVGTAGQSLGEVSAYRFGKALDDENLILLGVGRHDAMRDAPGTLAGFYAGDSDERIKKIKKDYGLETSIRTSSGFVVLGGEIKAIDEAIKQAAEQQLKAVSLNTDGAFHTSKMREAAERYAEVWKKIQIKDALMDIYLNITAKKTRKSNMLIKAQIVQLTHCVAWEDSMDSMLKGTQQVVEIGSNGTLTSHIQRDIEKKSGQKRQLIKKILLRGGMAAAAIGVALVIAKAASSHRQSHSPSNPA